MTQATSEEVTCRNGHSVSEHRYYRPDGRSDCRACRREARAHVARQKVERDLKAREQLTAGQPCPDGVRLIPLSGEGGKGCFAMVDAADYDAVKYQIWHVAGAPAVYASRLRTARDPNGGHLISMHVFLMQPKQGEYVDHVNRHSLDNRRQNLRICTKAENQQNHGINKNNKSGFKGVSVLQNGRFRAEIRANGVKHSLGKYTTALEAARAYNNAAIKLHGEFAYLNDLGDAE